MVWSHFVLSCRFTMVAKFLAKSQIEHYLANMTKQYAKNKNSVLVAQISRNRQWCIVNVTASMELLICFRRCFVTDCVKPYNYNSVVEIWRYGLYYKWASTSEWSWSRQDWHGICLSYSNGNFQRVGQTWQSSDVDASHLWFYWWNAIIVCALSWLHARL